MSYLRIYNCAMNRSPAVHTDSNAECEMVTIFDEEGNERVLNTGSRFDFKLWAEKMLMQEYDLDLVYPKSDIAGLVIALKDLEAENERIEGKSKERHAESPGQVQGDC